MTLVTRGNERPPKLTDPERLARIARLIRSAVAADASVLPSPSGEAGASVGTTGREEGEAGDE